ncbi:glutamine--fructose-6-phosphate transaminase (isomerizing) [Candidatus Berkelbacteria bacterium]|nr:glutamine--fructose-6-phosphate transaminase (isomerizing) [Candidatus Berkelbacteria bacterium]
MCGIIGVIGTQGDAPKLVIDGLRSLEYRGYDSWGIAYDRHRKTNVERAIGKLDESAEALTTISATVTKRAIGHTRWATHGSRSEANAHPHRSCDGKLIVVHNGIIENYQALKAELADHAFRSETDTEVLAHLIEAARPEHDTLADAVRAALKRIHGSYAVVVMEEGGEELIGARRGSPLVVGLGADRIFLASDVPAFLAHTRRVIYLDDGQLVVARPAGVVLASLLSGDPIQPTISTIDWDAAQVQKGPFAHFMVKEIHEQPATIRAAVAHPAERIAEIAEQIQSAYGTFFVACGSAYHAGLTGTYLFSQLAGKHVNITVASEFPSYRDFLTDRTLLIPISQSGETADTLEAVRAAKRKGSRVLAVVNVQGSTLVREADDAILTQAGPEICVLATKSFTGQVALITLLAHAVDGRADEGRTLVEHAAGAVETFLSGQAPKQIKQLASEIASRDHLYTIGRGLNYPTALEAALKIKEVSYVHAEGFAGGELKHGPIALIDDGTPVLVFVANDETKPEILSNAMELRSRGARIIGVSPEPNEIFHDWITVADLPGAMPMLGAIPAQLLAYELAVARGTDPDKPRNLAKSVTVK